jgi:Condensation domain
MKTSNSAHSKRNILQELSTLSSEHRELFERLLVQQGEDLAKLPIPPRDPCDPIPFSYPQERVWTIAQLTQDSSVDNVPVGFRLLGAFNSNAFEQAIRALIQRNEILRTYCILQNEQMTQSVQPTFKPCIESIDLRRLTEAERLENAIAQATEFARKPFDFEKDLLLRAYVFCLGDEDFVVLLVAHQLVTDGLSFRFLLQELASLYNASVTDNLASLTPIPVQYADFSIWQRQWFTDSILASDLVYWKDKLSEAPSELRLPMFQSRQFSTQKATNKIFKFSAERSDQFRTLSRDRGVTVFMAFVALFQIVLQRCTHQDDITIGTLTSNRNRRETETLIGNFSNNLLLRTHFTEELNFYTLLEKVRDTTLEAYQYQDLPFQYLFDRIENVPKFQVLLLLRNSTISQNFILPGLNVQDLEIDLGLTRMDFNLDITDDGKSPIFGKFEYKTNLFDELTIQQLVQNFKALLKGVLQNPNQKLLDISLPEEIRNFNSIKNLE